MPHWLLFSAVAPVFPITRHCFPSIKAEQSRCVTTELKQTARSCASTWGGQSDDCYVVSTAGWGRDPPTKGYDPLMWLISMMASLKPTHSRAHTNTVRHTDIGHGAWPPDPQITLPDVYLLIPSVLKDIHHHCHERRRRVRLCVCVCECDCSIMGVEWYAVCQYLLVEGERDDVWSWCVRGFLYHTGYLRLTVGWYCRD